MIIEVVGLMQRLGLNTLHLHLSDDQSMPIESAKYPQIKYDRMLSIADQEQIAAACKVAGIEIIPEIDIPGHLNAFLHIFRKDVEHNTSFFSQPELYLDMETELPIILDLYEEITQRFNAKYIHMGGDEAPGFEDYPRLLDTVCKWAKARKLQVIAWDEMGYYIDDATFPHLDTLIIHKWRGRIWEHSHKVRLILSYGYYLDHYRTPIEYYNANPKAFGPNLGCIACTWSETINEHNIWCSILPTLYMLALRWNEFPTLRPHLPLVLWEQCEKLGYPRVFKPALEDSWRMRSQGLKGLQSTSESLEADRFHYPACSRKLVRTQALLYRHLILGEIVSAPELETAIAYVTEATGQDARCLMKKDEHCKEHLNTLITNCKQWEMACQKEFNNGVKHILNLLCQSIQ